jgi:hypothetical protein
MAIPPKTKKPSKHQIAAEAKVLEKLIDSVPMHTHFGDNNHDAIRAQIWVLTHPCDEAKIGDRYLPADGADEASDEDVEEGRTFDIESAARDALSWKAGDPDIKRPSEDWKGLVDSKKRKLLAP